ncbi:MAG: hypothetical protein ABW352_00330 [Polyangiales bacterium]
MIRIACVGLLLGLSATALADGKRAPKPPPPPEDAPVQQDPNQCAKAEPHAQWVGIGYTHSVTLRNGCERPVSCTVWTDVDPEPKQTVQARPAESVEVVTRRGSPARELTAFKNCTFR